MDTTIEQACDPSNWRWKRWDVRADGKVFWCNAKSCVNNERWISWDSAIKNKDLRTSEKYKNYQKIYSKTQKRKDYHNLYQKSYRKLKRSSNPAFVAQCRLRCRISQAIRARGYSKTSKTNKMIGCDWNHLKAHLESQFVDGMSWENRHLWHVDHIIPLASATSEEDLIRLNHYTNLQPLWAADNLSKGAKILQ